MVVSFSSVDSRREYLLPRSLYTVLTECSVSVIVSMTVPRAEEKSSLLPPPIYLSEATTALPIRAIGLLFSLFMTSSFAWSSDIAFIAPAESPVIRLSPPVLVSRRVSGSEMLPYPTSI